MSKLGVASEMAILGRASVSGNLPQIKLPVKSTVDIHIPTDFISPPQSPKALKQNPKNNTSIKRLNVQTMDNLKKHLNIISENCNELYQVNHCHLISDLQLLDECQIIIELYKPLYKEGIAFITALQSIEENGRSNHYVGTSYIKQASYPFTERWKYFVSLINTIKKDGIKSLIELIKSKFFIVGQIIKDISTRQKRDSVHTATMLKEGNSLIELLNQVDESIELTVQQNQTKTLSNEVMESRINDVRAFLRIYNTVHYKEFVKSGYSQCELIQLKTDAQTACNDIIGAIRAAFSLESDLDSIFAEINNVQKLITRITEEMNMPIKIVHTVVKKTITDPFLKKPKKPDPLKKMKKYVEVQHESEVQTDPLKSIVVAGKLEMFIQKLCVDLKIPYLDSKIDVWDKLDVVRDIARQKITAANECMKEYELFQEKIKNQSGTITKLMKQTAEKESELSYNEKTANQIISDLRQQNEEIMKQRNEILHVSKKREEQLFKLRMQFNESKTYKMLQTLTDTVSKFLIENNHFQYYGKDDLVQRATKMNEVLAKKGCGKCKAAQDGNQDLKAKINKALGYEAESLSNAINALIQQNETKEKRIKELANSKTKAVSELVDLQKCFTEIQVQSKSTLQALSTSFEGNDTNEISQNVLQTFENMCKQHQQELKELHHELSIKHDKELNDIISLAISLSPPDSKELQATPIELIISMLEHACKKKSEFQNELTEINTELHKAKNWLASKCNKSVNSSVEELIKAFDELPNTLSPTILNMQSIMSINFTEVVVLVTKIAGIMKMNPPDFKFMETKDVLQYGQRLLDDLYDKHEESLLKTSLLTREQANIKTRLTELYLRIKRIKNEEPPESIPSDNEVFDSFNEIFDQYTNQIVYFNVAELNQMTEMTRNDLGIGSTLPIEYIPQICDAFKAYHTCFTYINKFEKLLERTFQEFDFEYKSYDPRSDSFNSLRRIIIEFHNILNDTSNIDNSINHLTKFVSLITAFYACIASASFDCFDDKSREEIYKFQLSQLGEREIIQ